MNKSMARPRLSGYTWRGVTGVCPQISAVLHCLCDQHGLGHYRHRPWILDYSFTPFGCFRVGRNAGPWIARPAHEAHLYSPGTAYWEDTTDCGVRATRSIYITFSGGNACGLAGMAAPYARFSDPEGRVGDLLTRIFAVARAAEEGGFWRAQALICEIIDLLKRADPSGPHLYRISVESASPGPSQMVGRVRAYLQDHIAEPVTRRDLARHANMSVSALAHRYRLETGESPMAALTGMRINLAKGLLLKGYRLKTIAEQAGFCDAFHLSKMFKRKEGMAPRAFLESNRAGTIGSGA